MDTSVILNYLGYNNDVPVKNECNVMLNNATSQGAMLAVSTISKLELEQVLIRGTFYRYEYFSEIDQKNLKLKNPKEYKKILDEAEDSLSNYTRKLFQNPNIFNEPIGIINDDILKKAQKIRSKYSISGVNDSLQIAIGLHEQVSHFATTDKDFYTVNDPILKILLNQENIDTCRKYFGE